MVTVRNATGTAGLSCHCPDWLEHYRNFNGGLLPFCCSVIDCRDLDLVGAHVVCNGERFIVPLCPSHNSVKVELTLRSDVKLVSANVATTCGKKLKQHAKAYSLAVRTLRRKA